MTHLQAFAKMFKTTPDDLDMHMIYDVSHNIAKVEEHFIDGKQKTLLVHRKGSTRAFPPHHPLIPVDFQVGSLKGINLSSLSTTLLSQWITRWVHRKGSTPVFPPHHPLIPVDYQVGSQERIYPCLPSPPPSYPSGLPGGFTGKDLPLSSLPTTLLSQWITR